MSESDKHSRLNKFEKRRKNTKLISIFLIAGALLIILLLGMWLFGGGNDGTEEQTGNNENESSDFLITEENEEEAENDNPEQDESDNDLASDEEANDEENEENDADEEIETEEAEPSDGNVAEAYTGDWSPVGTEQEGPHTTSFEGGSQDRIEMRRAITQATGLSEDNMVEWWIGNGGDQKAVATVSDTAETEVYRVFLSWVDNEGWQPTKVEILIENDKK
ncbi:YrrS family protein [Oceanobacillus polygoni]|uniref:Cobalamin biosynthesis protein CobT n=1 Tax=Oceanobacillus polygoni TaxID=1235259 RepID=A0A9X1CGR7_9BACI|nr:YrrS family protein [Oceanobacillus polygoni]MBP2077518.1 cobalamin biosynthesis protein CobT [Oceanobacillus polygoni]